MAPRHDSKLSNDDSIQGEMASKSGKYQQYPPPQALPDYLNRALPLPPRPSSNSSASSIYDSPGESTQSTAKQIVQSPADQYGDEHHSPIREDVLDEDGPARFQSPQPALTAAPPPSQEIVAPQPRYPASKVLEVKNYVVSPVSASLPGNNSNNNQQHEHEEVSPVSPGGSERSLHSRISESSQQPSSPSSSSSASAHHGNPASSPSLLLQRTKSDRRRAVYKGYRTTLSSAGGDPGAATSPRSPHYQVHQINDRYSDPGSPISGAVIHPPTSFPSDPSLRSSRQLNEAKLLQEQEEQHQIPAASNDHSSSHQSNGGDGNPAEISSPSTGHAKAKLATVPSSAGSGSGGGGGGSQQKVTFASLQRSDSGFAARPRAGTNSSGSRRTGKPPPPPLKLSERAIVDTYVKTPFPDLGGGEKEKEREKEKEKGKGKKGEEEKKKAEREKPMSRFSHGRGSSEDTGRKNRGAWLGKGKDKDKDKNQDGGGKENENENEVPNSAKKRNRVSSLPGFGLGIGRILRTGSVSGYKSERENVNESRETETQAQAQAQSQAQVQSPPPPVPSEVRSNYVETRASRPSRTPSVSKVKNMLSKAKQIGLNHGLGLGMMSSEEAKKERRRAEMKRQIRVGDPRPV